MKASKVVILIFLSILSLCVVNARPVRAAEDSWTTMADMPTPRLGPGVAVVNGKIYAIGGGNQDGFLNTNEEYDPATNTWATKKPMPTPRGGFAVAVYQNKIYCIGGGGDFDFEEVTGANEVYDPLTDIWTTKTPMPTPRQFLCANVVNGKIYLIGGSKPVNLNDPSFVPNVNEVYDPVSDSWTTKTPPPTQVEAYASAVVDNKIFIIGGTVVGYISNLTQIYHPETDTWSYGAPIPNAAWGAAAGATTGVWAPKRIYVIGGNPTFNLNQVYDPETDTWTMGAQMPTNRYGLGVAVVNDTLYAIGGAGGLEGKKNERYTPIGYHGPIDNTGPSIAVLSPENKTYHITDVSLNFTVNEPVSWMSYSLDSQANVTITGNVTLTGLSEGLHSLTVYAKDTAGNTGTSETIYFSIEILPKNGPLSESFPTIWVVAAMYMIAAGVAFLIYFVKVKKTHGKAEKTMPEAET